MKKRTKKQHIGSHSNHSFPVNKFFPMEVIRRIKQTLVYVDGQPVREDGKLKTTRRKMKNGLKDLKKFIHNKRRGVLKQQTRDELDNLNDEKC